MNPHALRLRGRCAAATLRANGLDSVRAERRRRSRRSRSAFLVLVALLAGCATMREAFTPAPQGKPSAREGWLVYELRDLRFEAPAGWHPSGAERRMTLEAPDGKARLEVSVADNDFPDERACLAAAEEKLKAQSGSLERARLHPTRFAGRPAQTLEADQGGWHLWAIASCDGGVQHRVFFTAATPAEPEALEAWKTLLASARIGGEA